MVTQQEDFPASAQNWLSQLLQSQLLQSGVCTSLRPFFALSAGIALNTLLRVCLTVATPFDRMACKVSLGYHS